MPNRLSLPQVHQILHNCRLMAGRTVQELGDDFPDFYDPAAGRWALNGGWTEGFWTGILWWLAVHSGDKACQAWAERYSRLLARNKADFSDHDLGFLFYHSAVLESQITGNDELLPAALAAARRLAERYNPNGRFIRAHGALDDPERAGYAIIDTIMNLRLLFWAHEQTAEPHFYEVARAVALTIAREYIREDGSTVQVVWFDPHTGAVQRKTTLQGFAPRGLNGDAQSCWSRGQAWGIYGFAQVCKFTGERYFLDQAARLARYFIDHLPRDGVAFYDFLDPAIPAVPRDTSAQAIAAAGLLALAELAAGEERRRYLEQAEALLAPLCAGYLVAGDAARGPARGFLRGGCYFLARNRGVDSELMFGDYYLVEALMRYLSLNLWR